MSKQLFICLANSWKHHARCIAGIKVRPSRNGEYEILRDRSGAPLWIRPVSDTGHGEIDETLVHDIKLRDVVEVEVKRPAADGAQVENVTFVPGSLRKVGNWIERYPPYMNKLLGPDCSTIFGDIRSSIAAQDIVNVGHSLVLVRPEMVRFVRKPNAAGNQRIRAEFNLGGVTYDLSVTDPIVGNPRQSKPPSFASSLPIYLTISLGTEYGDHKYYKLVAAVIVSSLQPPPSVRECGPSIIPASGHNW